MTDLLRPSARPTRGRRAAPPTGGGGPPLPPAGGERPRIDPRFARRWIDARREEGRRRLRLIVILASMATVVVLAFGSLFTPLFSVRHLRISVGGPLSAGAVQGLSGLTSHNLMIGVHAASVAGRIDADPWLGAAHVVRHWPGTVTISVVVRSALAAVADGNQYVEVDPTGRILAFIADPPLGMPVLQGVGAVPGTGQWLAGSAGPAAAPGAPASVLVDLSAASDAPDLPGPTAAALAIIQSLPGSVRTDVQTIDAAPGAISLVISPPLASGAITVQMGDGSQLQAKVTALMTLVGQAALTGVTTIDVTVPSRPALSSAGGPAG